MRRSPLAYVASAFAHPARDSIDRNPLLMAIAELARPAQHAWRNIDTVDASGRSNRGAQERKVSAAAAAHFENAVAVFEAQAIDRMFAQPRRDPKHPIE